MKKIAMLMILLALILSACTGNTPSTEQAVVNEQATVIAKVLAATQTAIVLEQQTTTQVAEITIVNLSTDYTDAAPLYLQLIVGVMKIKDTGQALTADQVNAMLSLLSPFATQTAETQMTEESINAMIDQALQILTAEQVQAISSMQLTQQSAMTAMQDLGLEMGGRQSGNGQAPAGEPGERPEGEAPVGGPGRGGPGQGDPAVAEQMGTPPSMDQIQGSNAIQPQLIQAFMAYLQSISGS